MGLYRTNITNEFISNSFGILNMTYTYICMCQNILPVKSRFYRYIIKVKEQIKLSNFVL